MKTRNKLLLLVCILIVAYTVADIVLGFLGMQLGYSIQLDSALTSEVFSFAKWIVSSGAAITIAKTMKGDTNSDEDERMPPE
jgi:hypothetical protein